MDKRVLKIACKGAARVDWADLKPLQKNLKSLDEKNYKKLRRGLEDKGQRFPLRVWQKGGERYIIGGHQTHFTIGKMLEDGWQVPALEVTFVDAKDKKEALRMVLLDVAQFGKVDRDGLYELMSTDLDMGIDELSEGFSLPDFDMGKFHREFFDTKTPETDADDLVPNVPENAYVKRGDVFILGKHRLMCGDATDASDVKVLMGQEKASVWLSDPPYGINHTDVAQEKGQAKGYSPILNDELQDEALKEFIYKSISTSLPFMKNGFAFYMWHAMKMQAYFSQAAAAAAAAGILFHRQIIWVKPQFVFGRGQYHWRHELCLMGWLQGNEPPFYGERNQSTVWEIGRENDKIHPTQKPVAIWEPAILNHTKPGEVIYEPFSGSGSNLIACEKNSRRCFGLELEPKYCAVILSRWAQFTGNDPVRERDGKPWSKIQKSKK